MTIVPEKARGFFQKRLPLILGIYILLQPLLDVLTTPTANAGIAISVGVVMRTLFMVFSFLYVVFVSRFREKKLALGYLAVLIAYLILFLVLMLSLGGLSQAMGNIKELVKVYFVPFVAVFLFAVYREYGYRVSSRSLAWAGSLYAFVILLAYVTGTSLVSYRSGYGYKGWFYAANEVGCIIAVAGPIAIWYCIRVLPTLTKKTWWKGVLVAAALFSIVFAANYIGTKIIFMAVLLYCLAAFVWCLVGAIRERSRGLVAGAVLMAVMVVLTGVMFLSSPLNGYLKDIYGSLLDVPTDEVLDRWSPTPTPTSTPTPTLTPSAEPTLAPTPTPPVANVSVASEDTWLRNLINSNKVVGKLDAVLSRRLVIAAAPVQEFIDGSAMTKLLGVGYSNSPAYSRDVSQMIEMDGVSIFIRQGVLGFLLYVLPYLLWIAYAVVSFFRHPLRRLSSLKYCTYLYATLVACAIAMVAGHVLTAPAVGTFMLAVTVNLLLMTREQDKGLDVENLT